MGDILGQLAFESNLFFFLGNVVDGNLEAGILEDDTFYDKCPSILIDGDRHSFFTFSSRTFLLILIDKMNDLLQFADGKDFFCCFQVGVWNQVTVLGEKIVDKNLFFVFSKYT